MEGAGWSRVTHPFATLYTAEAVLIVRLACVKHAASVHPEPGSNSPCEQRPEAPSDRCESRFCFKTLRRGLGPLTGKKLKLALSNVRLTSEKTFVPSLEFHPQYPVVKVPREASRPAALASGARKYFTGTRIPRQAVHEISTTSLSRPTGRPDRRGRRLPHFRKRQLAYDTAPGISRKGFFKIY